MFDNLNNPYNNISEIKLAGLDETCNSELKLDLNTDFSTKNQNRILTDINLHDANSLILMNNSKLLENSMNITSNPDLNSLYKISNPYLLLLGGKPDAATRKYDFENKKWNENKSFTVNKFDFTSVMYKDKKILILGGKVTVIKLINYFNLINRIMELTLQVI